VSKKREKQSRERKGGKWEKRETERKENSKKKKKKERKRKFCLLPFELAQSIQSELHSRYSVISVLNSSGR
jgi:hypothetical protein